MGMMVAVIASLEWRIITINQDSIEIIDYNILRIAKPTKSMIKYSPNEWCIKIREAGS